MRKVIIVCNDQYRDEIQSELNSLVKEFADTLEKEQDERASQLYCSGDITVHNIISAITIASTTFALRNLVDRDSGSVESLGFIVRRLSDRLQAVHLASSHPGKWSFPQKTMAVLHKLKNAIERRNKTKPAVRKNREPHDGFRNHTLEIVQHDNNPSTAPCRFICRFAI